MKSDPKRRIKISGNDLQTRGQGRRAVLLDSIFFVQQDDFGSVLG